MAWTDDDVTNFIQSLLNEYSSAKYWAAAEITLYKKAAMSTLLSKYIYQLYPIYGDWEDFAVTAGTRVYDLPSNCYRVAQVVVTEDGDKLRYIPRTELWKYADYDAGDVIGWTYKNNKIYVTPEPSGSDSDFGQIHYMPILDAVTEFPDAMCPLIGIQAALLALQKDKYDSAGLMALKREYEQNIYNDFELSSIEHVNVFPDYSEEDSFA
ncbi:MAG: hypothetical protein JRI45_06835 [Deltaproteobacteria bacterium]|nr:hypothetical protein [Deltaproteobacteria bacterium]